ncbi:MAG: hypothetical protein COV01_01565 [Candidatus Taylorbacteria bacterium CG10_big_fil_rev_8_21_14_0_10_41_48]|uniref:PilN domain-containing protein n=1 Tax=Candidatus Taylorbacteria bacterium CG10_big_fil_rev_8_21_14_0_10_41_48 TaxID=1975024 RepID=A0A2M8LC40_9BACT|nr:MAG: hypothetical protein COV01_01565 [Candidatus Taylorbacteria bacterium CG10_big_fil_rev_8_21_14_0_10_41_48]
MDPRFQTSFIPKKPVVTQGSTLSKTSTVSLFSLIAVVLFILTLALSGGVFFWKSLIQKDIDVKQTTLERARDAFEPDLIKKIIRLDSRIENTKTLLGSHISVTRLFDLLSTIALRSVRFKDFNFSYLAKDKIEVVMKGQAQSFAAVAIQSDFFNQQKYLKNTLIGDLALEPTGLISFSVRTTIDPTLVSYSGGLTQTPPPQQNQTSEVPVNTESNASSTTTQ